MKDEILVLQKGESMTFLDYTIKNSANNDGLVLMKESRGAKGYECHLGNYGTGTQENIDSCKRYAIMYFLVARPEKFATQMVNKAMRLNSGCMSEYYALKHVCENEGIELPSEITCGDSMNCMIYFKGKPLAKTKD
jgi:hypothetical protein